MARPLNTYERAFVQIGVKLQQMSQLAGIRLAEAMQSKPQSSLGKKFVSSSANG